MVKETVTNALVVLLTVIVFTTCSVSGSMAFSIGEERDVGEKLLYSVRSSFDLVEDPDIISYLTALGREVLDVAGIQYFDYHFYVINSKEFNAFAAPSGLIFFYTGLIEVMNSENELLSVLAHEIGHVAKRHLADRIEKGTYSSIASLGLALAAVAFGGSAAPVLVSGALAAGQSMNLHFSRQNEEEADSLAFTWLEAMRRNPEGQARMLESMRRIARYRSEKLPQYLLTHPNPEARLNYVEGLIDASPRLLEGQMVPEDNFSFLRFKYRVMSLAKQTEPLKVYLVNQSSTNDPDSLLATMATYGLAVVASKENDYDRALAYLDTVERKYPDRAILMADRGAILLDAGRLSEAETVLNDFLRKQPSNTYGTYLLGKLYYRQKKYEKAKNALERVSYELPEFSKVYYQLGQIASDMGKPRLAQLYLGKYYLYEGRLPQAEQSLQLAGNTPKKLNDEQERERRRLLQKIKKLQK